MILFSSCEISLRVELSRLSVYLRIHMSPAQGIKHEISTLDDNVVYIEFLPNVTTERRKRNSHAYGLSDNKLDGGQFIFPSVQWNGGKSLMKWLG